LDVVAVRARALDDVDLVPDLKGDLAGLHRRRNGFGDSWAEQRRREHDRRRQAAAELTQDGRVDHFTKAEVRDVKVLFRGVPFELDRLWRRRLRMQSA